MSFHIYDMVLSGLAYVIMVYFIMKMIKSRNKNFGDDDENDGGTPIHFTPDLDLPPGVSLPGTPPTFKDVEEEALH